LTLFITFELTKPQSPPGRNTPNGVTCKKPEFNEGFCSKEIHPLQTLLEDATFAKLIFKLNHFRDIILCDYSGHFQKRENELKGLLSGIFRSSYSPLGSPLRQYNLSNRSEAVERTQEVWKEEFPYDLYEPNPGLEIAMKKAINEYCDFIYGVMDTCCSQAPEEAEAHASKIRDDLQDSINMRAVREYEERSSPSQRGLFMTVAPQERDQDCNVRFA
jgi:hypothetical protein